jgi:hypothetical protein
MRAIRVVPANKDRQGGVKFTGRTLKGTVLIQKSLPENTAERSKYASETV